MARQRLGDRARIRRPTRVQKSAFALQTLRHQTRCIIDNHKKLHATGQSCGKYMREMPAYEVQTSVDPPRKWMHVGRSGRRQGPPPALRRSDSSKRRPVSKRGGPDWAGPWLSFRLSARGWRYETLTRHFRSAGPARSLLGDGMTRQRRTTEQVSASPSSVSRPHG